MTKIALGLVLLVGLTGCASRTFRTAITAQNPDATRVWVIMQDYDGDQKVVHCDQAFLASGSLCITWPTERAAPAPAPIQPPHYQPPQQPAPVRRAAPTTP